ncbi:DUF4177 domain-containing protein [Clostridium sp. 'deep sea']|uniref:DUF4177 domain-containing protein n=1 Tax=Clostridium sp. 'deep sea' TaxID=2779445 RepID=UPI0018967545|nr:DUF4177 domain-containing protein [Clostridium sp. 'deep sea']QOR33892.1 DUF4177 domain-containing protein [Clostridium sp. 'deep sea']
MYKYIFEESKGGDLFTHTNHREIIEEYGKRGYRFVTAIPTYSTGSGKIKSFDLVFEIEE